MQCLAHKFPDFFNKELFLNENISNEIDLDSIHLMEGEFLVSEFEANELKQFKHFEAKDDDIKIGQILKMGHTPLERSYFQLVRPKIGQIIAYSLFAGDSFDIMNKTYKIIQDREIALFLRAPDVFMKNKKD